VTYKLNDLPFPSKQVKSEGGKGMFIQKDGNVLMASTLDVRHAGWGFVPFIITDHRRTVSQIITNF